MVETMGFTGNKKIISQIDGKNKAMLMDVEVIKLEKGSIFELKEDKKEVAILLFEGNITYKYHQAEVQAKRRNVFEDEGYCLHVSKGKEVCITALDNSEILVQKTINDNEFETKLYTPEDIIVQKSSTDIWESMAAREIKVFFDYNNAPYSNMVIGEVLGYQGRWSSYIPHHHAQPEIYYYKFDKTQGFGACFIGDEAFKVKDGSFAAIEGGYTHPQVAAPGYRMYYCWMIRHFDDDPWRDRIDDKDHLWLLNEK